jgi:predicted TIM-barrel fold metal-dependent hydrolase
MKLAEEPNIWMKTRIFWKPCPTTKNIRTRPARRALSPMYDRVGPSKMMWGSNYPPVLRACTYPQAVTFVSKECKFLSEADKKTIFADNLIKYIKQAGGRDLVAR